MADSITSLSDVLALALVTGDCNTPDTYTTLLSTVEQIKSLALSGDDKRLVSACDYLLRTAPSTTGASRTTLFTNFSSALQHHSSVAGTGTFPGESSANVQRGEPGDSLDDELLVDFIEKHLTMMEEMEAELLDLRQFVHTEPSAAELNAAREEVNSSIKRYIHTVKGDAGVVGLHSIAKACHEIEDCFSHYVVADLVDPLLSLKEWSTKCMNALAHNQPYPESTDSFLARFSEECDSCVAALTNNPTSPDDTPPQTSAQPVSITPEGIEINQELLAELLAEENASKAAASAPATSPAPDGEYTISGELELFAEFKAEAEDHLNNIESLLLESGTAYDKQQIDAIFRGIHSIKGASAYFTLKECTETSHLTENLLDQVRTGGRAFDQGLKDLLLQYVEVQRKLMADAQSAFGNSNKLKRSPISGDYLQQLELYQGASSTTSASAGAATHAPTPALATAPDSADTPANKPVASGTGDKLEVKNFVKVDILRLDQLIDSIGEMCIYSTMLVQQCRTFLGENEQVIQTTHQVEKFSRDLQGIGMSMRLVPVRGLFQKMSRLVWDTAKKIGKEIKLDTEGEDTELDRTIIDKLADPLMHMVRNAVDHGVEPPDQRIASGKPRSGRVKLKAYQAGGAIHIQIIDDGRGLDPDKLVKKAIEKNIIDENHGLSRSEILELIFAAGFSTATVVTDISGRGVGMDVVRRNIESMRGRVHIESEVGKGTTFTIELPLTLAIMDGIHVGIGQETFIVPTLSVIEFMRPDPRLVTRTLDRGETYQFRGSYLPIYRMAELFGISNSRDRVEESIIVVVESGLQQFALLVDEILGTYSTVIKGLGELFEHGRGIAGCSIMANGEVTLILDIHSLLQLARSNYRYTTIAQLKSKATVALMENNVSIQAH